jgi:hypothetical protein
MRRAGRDIAIIISFALGFWLAIGSVAIHRQVTMVVGNACESTPDNPHGFCDVRFRAGGWPFPYLYNTSGISVRGSLNFPNDDLVPGWFLADVVALSALPVLILVAVDLLRRRTARPAVYGRRVVDVAQIRTAVVWTVGWFLIAGAVSLPLAAVDVPLGNTCETLHYSEARGLVLVLRNALWLALAVSLPVSTVITAMLAWRSYLSVRRCITIGVGMGAILALATFCGSFINAGCSMAV